MTAWRRIETLKGVIGSGKVSTFAKRSGMPISFVPILGSGEITERHVKLTRLPIIFIRKRPCFRSSSCFTPGGSRSVRAPEVVESEIDATALHRSSQTRMTRSVLTVVSTPSLAAAALP